MASLTGANAQAVDFLNRRDNLSAIRVLEPVETLTAADAQAPATAATSDIDSSLSTKKTVMKTISVEIYEKGKGFVSRGCEGHDR